MRHLAQPVILRLSLLVFLLLAGRARVPAATRGGNVPHRPNTNTPACRIWVNSTLSGSALADGQASLADALARAAADPRDNVIAFAPAVFGSSAVTLHLAAPIVVETASTGDDRIDATTAGAPVILDVTGCADAGVIVGHDARFTLIGVTVTGGTQRAILAKDNAQLALKQVAVRDSRGPGLALFDRAKVSLRDCQVSDNKTHGLELHGQASAELNDTTLSGNSQSGVAAFHDATVNGRHCRIVGNGDWNLVQTHYSRTTWSESQFRQGRFANVDISESASVVLDDCVVAGGQRFGLFATGRARVAIRRTQVRQHAGRGIELQDCAHADLNASRVESSGDYGAIVFGQAAIEAVDSGFAYNGAHGVSLCDRAAGRFSGCAFVGNRYSGIGCPDADQGGLMLATRCVFQHNGMRPIYRGPFHLDPLVPTPLHIEGSTVHGLADPDARIELFLDPVGEAARYLTTITADPHGRFEIDTRQIPAGYVMTAAATARHATSEFNVIAAPPSESILSALLGQTGPLSDEGGPTQLDSRLRRWPKGTRLVFHIENAPGDSVTRYARLFVRHIEDWTAGAIHAELQVGPTPVVPPGGVVIPIRYLPADAPQLLGRGGVTFMKWAANGYFVCPMEILLATGKDPGESCPRILAHEIAHTLGLGHARVGLLSRMQGTAPPDALACVNDFSPILTYYDVQALHAIHDRRIPAGATLAQLAARGLLPPVSPAAIAQATPMPAQPTFSPAAPLPPTEFKKSR